MMALAFQKPHFLVSSDYSKRSHPVNAVALELAYRSVVDWWKPMVDASVWKQININEE
jgi:hypothetical protein